MPILSKLVAIFFADDLVSEAKKTIWSLANYATRPSERLKVADKFADILKVLDYCDKNSVELPKFVIYEPDEVPTIPGEASATLTRKVNDLCLECKNFVTTAKYRASVALRRVVSQAPPIL